MKKKWLGLLLACLLLCGCRSISYDSAETCIPAGETLQPIAPLLEQGAALEDGSNLRYIPNGAVESMVFPQMRLLGNGLLLSEHRERELVLKHISLEDGTLVAQTTVPAGADTKLYIGNGEIGLCDRESGLISILSEGLQLQRTYEVSPAGDDWYLNSALDTLYILDFDKGLLARNLETQEEIWLVDNGFCVAAIGGGGGYVLLEYTDREDQKIYTRCLNLATASLETLPVGDSVSSGTRQGETWLLQSGQSAEDYILVQDGETYRFTATEPYARLLSSRRHLLMADVSGRNLTLYQTDGEFLSGCALPQNSNAAVGGDFVWSGYWEGYFFTDTIDSSCRLMFWDVNAEIAGEDLQLLPGQQAQQPQTLLEQLYQRAEQLSRRFGVDIRIGEQCTLDYSHYDTYALLHPDYIRDSLDVLEESLSQYPEGFFHQLRYGSIESIRIELVGGLSAKDEVEGFPADVGAFAQDRGSYYVIVADGFLLQPQTMFHEISHIIDGRLKWDSQIRENALYSQEAWLDLQPEGFCYAMTYTEIPEEVRKYMESGYFITEYSLTFPSEDRAVLMETAMCNYSWGFEQNAGRKEKLRYYAACIRDCFDTTGWPETTVWEQVLN